MFKTFYIFKNSFNTFEKLTIYLENRHLIYKYLLSFCLIPNKKIKNIKNTFFNSFLIK